MKVKFGNQEINLKRIGILTGGGDCAGHNAVIVGLLRRINQANLSLPKRYLLSPGGELLSPERYLLHAPKAVVSSR